MSSQRRSMALEPTSRAAAEARRWVADACRELDRHDLVECAAMGVTELVSNAVIHAVPPLAVVVRGTRAHLRVEVHDGMTTLPEPPPADDDSPDDDFLATFGRGLAIVARSSVAWGARAEQDGKVVWFEPAPEVQEKGAVPHLDSRRAPEPVVREGLVEVHLLGLDPDLHRSVARHSHELRRELLLLALAHEDDYPVAATISATWREIEQLLRQEPWDLVSAGPDPQRTDVVVEVPPDSARPFARMLRMLDLADDFCRDEKLLVLRRTPAQRDYHSWMLGEFVRQLDGGHPRPWRDPDRDPATTGASAR